MESSWKSGELTDFLDKIIGGGTPSKKIEKYWNGKIPWASVKDFEDDNYILKETQDYISEDGLRNSSANLIPSGIPIMCTRMAVGRVAVSPYAVAINQDLKAFYPNNELDLSFFLILLSFLNTKFKSKSVGSTVKGVSLKDINSVNINFPSNLKTQKKIAKILSTVDAVIEKTESAIAKYQAIKQGLMHDLFTRGIDVNTGKLRPTPQDAPDLYKESALGLIPREWEDSVFKNHLIKNLYGPRFSGDDYDSEGNVKTIRGMDFSKDGEILYSQAPIALLPKSKVYSHLLETGDVVMVTTADCGLTAVFEEQDFQFIPSAYSVKFRFNEEIEPYFIKFFMQTDKAKRLVNKYVRQGTLGNLPGSDVLGFNITLPKIDEQRIIIEKLKAVESKIQTEQQALAKYQQLKAGLLQDLLTGKVAVSVD